MQYQRANDLECAWEGGWRSGKGWLEKWQDGMNDKSINLLNQLNIY